MQVPILFMVLAGEHVFGYFEQCTSSHRSNNRNLMSNNSRGEQALRVEHRTSHHEFI